MKRHWKRSELVQDEEESRKGTSHIVLQNIALE